MKLRFLLAMFLLFIIGAAYGQEGEPGVLHNPLNLYGGADPWLTYYDGNYYLAATTWASNWQMRKSPTLAGLKTAEPVQIYYETDPSRCCNFWAPEFYLLEAPDGTQHWYFYYTAGTPPGNYDNQRIHVLESEGTDPLGPYTYKGRVYDPSNDTWMIDGSVMELNGELYFLFSAFQGTQSMFIAPMENPWTLGTRALLSQPEYAWEEQGGTVNEGPVALHHDDDTFIIYSASSCNTPDYKLGMLTYNGGDPLSAESWDKHPEPVFQRSDENGVYAPGHNGFFKSPDGTEDWLVYHANDSVEYGCDGRRSTRVQKINWNADGTPDFGVPLPFSAEIAAPSGDTGIDPLPEFPPLTIALFKTLRKPEAYIRHANFQMRLDFITNGDAQFVVQPGNADPEAVSFESVNFPGFFLRHQNNILTISPDDLSDDYAASTTWWMRPGVADETLISFEPYSQPGSYIGVKFGVLALVKAAELTTDRAREDATFYQEQKVPSNEP
jgi:GH43 family beta-xylosidase